MERFIKLGAFNTAKTASNQWSALKKKLISMASAVEGGEVGPIMPGTFHDTIARSREHTNLR